jgi:hypothetical protein
LAVAGGVWAVWLFTTAHRDAASDAAKQASDTAQTRLIEAQKPFLDKQLELYVRTSKAVGTLVTTNKDSAKARKLATARQKQIELLVLKSELHGLIAKDEALPHFDDNIANYNAGRQRDAALPMRDEVQHFLNVTVPNHSDEVWARASGLQRAWKQARIALRTNTDAQLPD